MLSGTTVMSAAYEADNNSAIAYQFSGTDASTPGYAEGTITFTPADKGKYNLYWADDEKALYGYLSSASDRVCGRKEKSASDKYAR